jgi:hypothetical protein
MYRRAPDQVYGMGAAAYDARLVELMAMLRSDESARAAGVVRSLYGNAVHRAARTGEAFTIWVEQSGGLSVGTEARF